MTREKWCSPQHLLFQANLFSALHVQFWVNQFPSIQSSRHPSRKKKKTPSFLSTRHLILNPQLLWIPPVDMLEDLLIVKLSRTRKTRTSYVSNVSIFWLSIEWIPIVSYVVIACLLVRFNVLFMISNDLLISAIWPLQHFNHHGNQCFKIIKKHRLIYTLL